MKQKMGLEDEKQPWEGRRHKKDNNEGNLIKTKYNDTYV